MDRVADGIVYCLLMKKTEDYKIFKFPIERLKITIQYKYIYYAN